MNLLGLLAAVCTVIGVVGLLMIVIGWYGRAPGDPRGFRRLRVSGAATAARTRGRRIAVAIAVGAAAWFFSGWPVAGVTISVLVLAVPYFFGGAAVAKRRIERLRAMDEWVRRLADTMAIGQAPVQAIVDSAEHVGLAIRPEVARLASRLSTPRLDRHAVLVEFARELDDSVGDEIADQLDMAVSATSTKEVPDMLRILAEMVSEDVRGQQEIEARRAGPRSESRLIVGVQILIVVGLSFVSGYMQPYSSVTGQLVMAVLAAAMLGTLYLLRRFSLGSLPPRIPLEGATQ